MQTTRDTVALPPGRISLDLDRLASGEILGDESKDPLKVEPFLDGFDIPDAPEFNLWKDRQQARLMPAVKDALVALINQSRRTGDSRNLELLADRMSSLDDLSEEAIRAKMEARAFAGDRLTGLKLFEEWKARLSEELGAAPSQLVEGIAVRLRRRGWERTVSPEIPAVHTDQWRGRLFVGRSREYRSLYAAWEDMRDGQAVQILLLGDSGVGKTTLIERLTTAAGLEGAVVSRVQCYDLDREVPYAAVGTLIHGLLDRPGVSGAPPESLAQLARTVPEIRRRFPNIPPSVDSHGETARIRLSESFYDLLQAISDEHPVILVIDDAHLADDASLAAIQLVLRRAAGQQRILLILAARTGDPRAVDLANRLTSGSRTYAFRVLEVLPLTDEDSNALLNALSSPQNPQPRARERSALLRAAAGIPMAIELLYADWVAFGDQCLALAVTSMTADLNGCASPPHFYSEALARLVRALDPCTHSVLNLASVLGHRLNDVSLYHIVDLGVGQTMTGMASLVSRRVLRDGGKGLEFVNEVVRTAAYLGVPSPLRRALHSSVADRLLAREEEGNEALGLEIAWHCMRAGRVAEATSNLLRGAREAIRSGAPQEAERALSTALPSLTGDTLHAASLLLAEVLYEQGRGREALDILATVPTAGPTCKAEKVFALQALAQLSLGQPAITSLQDQLPQLEDVVRSAPEAATRAMAGRAMAYILGERRNHQLTAGLLRLLDAIPRSELDPDSLGQLALSRALLLFNTGDTTAAFLQATAGIEELRHRNATNLVMVQLEGGLGSIRLREGSYEDGLSYYKRALAMANRLGNDRQIAKLIGNIALCCGRLGRYSEQLDWVVSAPLKLNAEFAGFVEIQLTYSRTMALAMLGRSDSVARHFSAMDDRLLGPVPSWMLQVWDLWKADVLTLAEQSSAAIEIARTSLDKYDHELQSPAFGGPYARWLTRAACSSTERELAKDMIRTMIEQMERFDFLDQLEILCSWHLLAEEAEPSHYQAEIRTRLSHLPEAVSVQLTRLGFLQ